LGLRSMCELVRIPGFYGVVVGVFLFLVTWLLAWLVAEGPALEFDAQGEKGAFEPLLSNYLDVAKFVLGLASGSIVLLVGSVTFHAGGRLPSSFASPLFLLALSIIYGVLFMAFMMLDYEDYRHHPQQNSYTRFKYSRNQAFGFGGLACFCIGYVWLIIIVTGQP